VEVPIGPESVFAFATEHPVTLKDLGLSEGADLYSEIDPVIGPEFARCLESQLDRARETSAFARLDYVVQPETRDLPYTYLTIEDYFANTTRSYTRPTLDLLIHFESGSAELGSEARAQLDEAGKALAGARLSSLWFRLNGHTDDVGAQDYNQTLSQRRADAARRYLVEKDGVDGKHLSAAGWGKSSPKMAGTGRAARDENRRVELELMGAGRERGSSYQCGTATLR
jgi:outer membrane protein OmpA-like peptidoglycan-associated protein